jgi:hypothetical protein
MSKRLAAPWLLTAVLIAAAYSQPSAMAKPPELPRNEKITCDSQNQPSNSVILSIGLSSDSGVHGNILVDKPQSETTACDLFQKCLSDLFRYFTGSSGLISVDVHGAFPFQPPISIERTPVVPTEEGGAEESTEPPPSKPSPSTYVCPYLQQKEAEKHKDKEPQPPAIGGSVLENLDKLEKAHKIYRHAEHCRRTGLLEEACWFYEEVHELCPGSRYDHKAVVWLQMVQAQLASDAIGESAEEQEALPPPHAVPAGKPQREVLPMPHEEACPEKQDLHAQGPSFNCSFTLCGLCLNTHITTTADGHGSYTFGVGVEFLDSSDSLGSCVVDWLGSLMEDRE